MNDIKQTHKIGENSSAMIAVYLVKIIRPHHLLSKVYGLMMYNINVNKYNQYGSVKVSYGLWNYVGSLIYLSIFIGIFIASTFTNTHAKLINSTIMIKQLSRVSLILQILSAILSLVMDFLNTKRIEQIFNVLVNVDIQVRNLCKN